MNFTLTQYSKFLKKIKESKLTPITFKEYFSLKNPKKSLIIRHDIDRKPKNALKMAKLEKKYKIKSVYYFRTKKNSLDPKIIKQITKMGHEIGYHYECLSDGKGNISKALIIFQENLTKLKKITNIYTISMHGRPFNKWNNLLIWKKPENHQLIKNKFKLLGEVYLDINYKDILYITDSGRNFSNKFNKNDKVNSEVKISINNFSELLDVINNNKYPKIIISFHPERWTNNPIQWIIQFFKDQLINISKTILK